MPPAACRKVGRQPAESRSCHCHTRVEFHTKLFRWLRMWAIHGVLSCLNGTCCAGISWIAVWPQWGEVHDTKSGSEHQEVTIGTVFMFFLVYINWCLFSQDLWQCDSFLQLPVTQRLPLVILTSGQSNQFEWWKDVQVLIRSSTAALYNNRWSTSSAGLRGACSVWRMDSMVSMLF